MYSLKKGAKVLITGGMGFIGSHLADRLVDGGVDVTIYDSQERKPYIPAGVKWAKGDIRDFERLREECAGKDGIIHLAAVSRASAGYNDPLACITANVVGTANVLESIRRLGGNSWIILASSRAVADELSTGSNVQGVSSIYGVSKLAAELFAMRFAQDYGLRVMALRFSEVYGSGRDNPDKVVPKLIMRALQNLDLKLESPEQKFDFIHWADIVNGIFLGIQHIEKAAKGYYDDFTLCTGQQTSLKELTSIILGETGARSKVIYSQGTVEKVDLPYPDPGKAETGIGFRAKVNLREGVRETVEILKAGHRANGTV